MNILGKYKNGNYTVTIFDDGTKVRSNKLDFFEPSKPESMDLKISNKCYGNGSGLCPMCHECSSPEGKHGDILNLPFLDTLLPYTEVAIGGGNPLLHPDLVQFLKGLKTRKLIANMTVNQWTFMQSLDYLKSLVDEKLIYGVGVSLTDPNDKFIEVVKEFPNVVIHVINGIVSRESLQKLANNGLKILILGYKEFGRGDEFYKDSGDEINILKREMYDALPDIINDGWFKCVSFDNLAIKQLDPKRLMDEDKWQEFYMGDDGQFTMYVDAVNREYAMSSTSVERWPITSDIKDMFEHVKEYANG
nr:MAG TPA: hypothetical protein [Caudoviricetes sp.]